MNKVELGVKRRCLSCSKAFFDLNRTPPVCPSCKTVFEVIEIAHSAPRRSQMDALRSQRRPVVEAAAEDPALSEDAPSPSDEQDADDDSVMPPIEDEDENIQPDVIL